MPSTGHQTAGAGSGWTNSSNIAANDGSVASSSVYRSDFPEPLSTSSPNLVASSFGIGGLAASDAVSGVEVVVEASKSGSCQVEMFAYLSVSGVPVGSSKSLGLLGAALADLSAGSSADSWGASLNGAQLPNIEVVVFCVPTSPGDLTAVSVDRVTLNAHYTASGPSAFSLGSLSGQSKSAVVESSVAPISGLSGSAVVNIVTMPDDPVASPQWRKNGGAWQTAAGTVVNGDNVQMRHTTASTQSTSRTSRLIVNSRTADFVSTTAADDTTPNSFSFFPVNGVAPSTSVFSERVAISGITAAAPVSVVGGQYSINGLAPTSSAGAISNLNDIQAVANSSSTLGATVQVTITVGGVSATFDVTTRAAITTPSSLSFTDVGNQATSTVVTSNEVTISGIEAAASVSFSSVGTATSREYRKFSGGAWGAWTAIASTTVQNGEKLQLRLTTDAGAGVTGGISVTIGDLSDAWTATTLADVTPNAFSLGVKSNVIPGDPGPHYSNEVQITGIGTTVAGSASFAEIADNVSTPISSGYADPNTSIQNNDYIEVRTKATAPIPKCGQQTLTIPVTVGDVTVNWQITTKPGMPAAFCLC